MLAWVVNSRLHPHKTRQKPSPCRFLGPQLACQCPLLSLCFQSLPTIKFCNPFALITIRNGRGVYPHHFFWLVRASGRGVLGIGTTKSAFPPGIGGGDNGAVQYRPPFGSGDKGIATSVLQRTSGPRRKARADRARPAVLRSTLARRHAGWGDRFARRISRWESPRPRATTSPSARS